MATDPKLESYLSALERALKQLPVSDRADIVTEIKSHVLDALDRDPQKPIDSVLEALGPAESVANRYLLERGQQTVKPPISPVVKWMVIGFLGTLAMIFLFFGLLLFRFSPVLSIDGKNEKVTVLGGLVSIDGKNETVSVGGKVVDNAQHDVQVEVTDAGKPGMKVKVFSKTPSASPSPDRKAMDWDKE